MPHLILASGSPRRVELLGRLVASFRQVATPVEETGSDLQPGMPLPAIELPRPFRVPSNMHSTLWAWRKAMHVTESNLAGECIVLGADTIVIGPGEVLGKPKTPEDAVRMLRLLSGREHYVVTGFSLVGTSNRKVETLCLLVEVSCVAMREATDDELKGYVATGEPMDKAGAYALQGLGGQFVSRVDGCWTNVIGLPLCRVRAALAAVGANVLPYPAGGYCNYCALREPAGTGIVP